MIPLNVDVCRRGAIFRPRLPGMLVKNICCWGMLGSAAGYPISLIFDDLLGEGCIVLLSGEFRYTGHVL